MANITQLIANIRAAIYGREVRESIASAIEQCYQDATQVTPANTLMEVIQARDSYENLNARENAQDAAIVAEAEARAAAIVAEAGYRSAADTTINARIDSIATLAQGSTTGDAELIDIRVQANGVTASSAGDAVRNQFSILNSTVQTALAAENTSVLLGAYWESGGIKTDGTDIANTARIRTNYITIPANITRLYGKVATNYKYIYYLYDSNRAVVSTLSTWQTAPLSIYVPTNAVELRITIAKSNDATIPVSDGGNMEMTYSTYIVDKVNKALGMEGENVPAAAWESGGVKADGTDIVNTARIRTKYIDVSDIDLIECGFTSGYKYLWYFYNDSKTMIASQPTWVREDKVIEVPATAAYLRFCMGNDSDSTIQPAAGGNLTIDMYMPSVSKIHALTEYCFGDGNTSYYGDRVSLSSPSKQINKCSINAWLDVTQTTVPDMANYAFWTNQSIAIYGGYVFVLFNGGTGVVLDYSTKAIVGTISGYTDNNHQNSAQFTDYFYDSSDDFPLIAISRYGNIGGVTGKDQCLLMRIQKSGTVYNFTLVNTIEFEGHTYGNSWGVDVNSHTITMLAYINDDYTVMTNNPMYFYTWRMPDKAAVLSGEPITLAEADCIYKANTSSYGVLQAIYCMNGKGFLACNMNGSQGAFVIDLATAEILTVVPIATLSEAEGIAVYNEKLYLSNRKGTDASEANPMTIHEIEF